MPEITQLLSDRHRQCDDLFAAAEEAAHEGRWSEAAAAAAEFRVAMENHFAIEESILFPAFEAATGMRGGPTQVMRQEHAQMRTLLDQLADAANRSDRDAFAGAAETTLVLMQQHNVKEENILYPMCDRSLAADLAELLPQLSAGVAAT